MGVVTLGLPLDRAPESHRLHKKAWAHAGYHKSMYAYTFSDPGREFSGNELGHGSANL